MLERLAIAAVALIALTGVSVFDVSAPVQAQSSCMHCNFTHGKCRQLRKDTAAGCEAQHAQCVKACKSETTEAPKTPDKTRAADTKKKN